MSTNIMVAPTFKFTGIKMNPENEYIIEGFHWIKTASPEDIVLVARLSHSLTEIGFRPTMRVEEFPEGQNLYGVAIITHPMFGPLKLSIVAGPDYEIVKQALDINVEKKIIEETATFTKNVHPVHTTRQ
jgi:hypothetical protein